MPFGRIFGALFFGAVCVFGALRAGGAVGLAAAALALALGVALLTRRGWPRWAGIAAAAAVTVVSGARLGLAPTPFELLILLAAPLTAALLLWPGTGRRADGERPTGRDPLAWAATGALVVLVAATAMSGGLPRLGTDAAVDAAAFDGAALDDGAARTRGAPAGPGIPAGNAPREVPDAPPQLEWSGFDDGLAQAREENRPMLVHFTATWCGYCRKMDRETWTHPSVVREASDWIPVRVDIDRRQDLAGRYAIRGTPSQLLVDPSGKVLARAGGFQTPRQFLDWLEQAAGRIPGATATRAPVRGLSAGER